ncbi:MAG: hypothetical protein ABSA02_31875 [Trebonia sp.]
MKPEAQPTDGAAMASAVRFALAPAATAGPGHGAPPVGRGAADGTVNAATPIAVAVAAVPALTADGHER